MPVSRVIAFTGQPVLAEGFRRVLEAEKSFDFRGVCREADEFIENLQRLRPEVAVLDSASISGPQFFSRARAAWRTCGLVLWAEDLNVETIRHAFDLGINGVLSNRSAPDAFVAAIERIARGELYFPNLYCTPRELASSSLTPRERQLTALIAQGLKNKEIAAAMGLQEGTVKVYLSRIYRRLHVADRFELALQGLQAFFGDWDKAAWTPGRHSPVHPRQPEKGPSPACAANRDMPGGFPGHNFALGSTRMFLRR